MLAAVLAIVGACSRPLSYEKFIRAGSTGADGLYRYSLDLSDSLAAYDLSFYSRIDRGSYMNDRSVDFPLKVTWTSPSGRKYSETVYFPVGERGGGSDFFSGQYRIPYRVGFVPLEHGAWDLEVLVNSGNALQGFRGLGIICEKRPWDTGN